MCRCIDRQSYSKWYCCHVHNLRVLILWAYIDHHHGPSRWPSGSHTRHSRFRWGNRHTIPEGAVSFWEHQQRQCYSVCHHRSNGNRTVFCYPPCQRHPVSGQHHRNSDAFCQRHNCDNRRIKHDIGQHRSTMQQSDYVHRCHLRRTLILFM